jgi:hypothetical protein
VSDLTFCRAFGFVFSTANAARVVSPLLPQPFAQCLSTLPQELTSDGRRACDERAECGDELEEARDRDRIVSAAATVVTRIFAASAACRTARSDSAPIFRVDMCARFAVHIEHCPGRRNWLRIRRTHVPRDDARPQGPRQCRRRNAPTQRETVLPRDGEIPGPTWPRSQLVAPSAPRRSRGSTPGAARRARHSAPLVEAYCHRPSAAAL